MKEVRSIVLITHIYGIQKKMALMDPIDRAGIETRRERICGHSGGRRGWDELRKR